MTPHNRAKINEIAKKVLLPGDPNRARFVAENFFENPKLVTDVRGILGYTGTYKGIVFLGLPGEESTFEMRIGTDSFESSGIVSETGAFSIIKS